MKNIKKLVALILVMALAVSMVVTANAFPDVTSETKYAEAINRMAALGILSGRDTGEFDPTGAITRAEFAKIVYVIYNGVEDVNANLFKGPTNFSDVAKDAWYTGYVNWATQNGIIGGYEDGTFKPDANVKVAEAVKMLVVAIQGSAAAGLVYPFQHITAAQKLGLFKGAEINNIEENATRGLIAQIANIALSKESALILVDTGNVTANGEAIYAKRSPLSAIFKLGEDKAIFYGSTAENLLALNNTANTIFLDDVKIAYTGDTTGMAFHTVKFFYVDNNADGKLDAKDELISLEDLGNTKTAVVANCTTSGSGSSLTYKVNGEAVKFDADCEFGVQANNGLITESDLTVADFFNKKDDFVVSFVDTEGDGDIDVAVKYIQVNAQTVTKVGDKIAFGAGEIAKAQVVAYNGLAVNDVVDYTVAAVNGKTVYTLAATAQIKNAQITKVSADGKSAEVGGLTYSFAADGAKSAFEIGDVTKKVNLVLDLNGNVLTYSEYQAGTAAPTDKLPTYGIVTGATLVDNGAWAKEVALTILLPDGSYLNKVTFAGEATTICTNTAWFDSSATATNGVVMKTGTTPAIVGAYVVYELDNNGEIKALKALNNTNLSAKDTLVDYTAGQLDWTTGSTVIKVMDGKAVTNILLPNAGMVAIVANADPTKTVFYKADALPSFDNLAVTALVHKDLNNKETVIALFFAAGTSFESAPVVDNTKVLGSVSGYSIEAGAKDGTFRYVINGWFADGTTQKKSADLKVADGMSQIAFVNNEVTVFALENGLVAGVDSKYTFGEGADKYAAGVVSINFGTYVGVKATKAATETTYYNTNNNTKVYLVAEKAAATTGTVKATASKITVGSVADIVNYVTDTNEYTVVYSVSATDALVIDEIFVFTTKK